MLAAVPAAAQVELDGAVGRSFPSASGYESGRFANASFGYVIGDWVARAGYLHVGEFELESAPTAASVEMSGYYLQAVRRFPARVVDWELGLGAAKLESLARLGGRPLARQTEWEPFLELAATKKVVDGLFVKGGYLYLNDQVGSDVSALFVGLRFSF